jgi:hypothetical protein
MVEQSPGNDANFGNMKGLLPKCVYEQCFKRVKPKIYSRSIMSRRSKHVVVLILKRYKL